MLPFKAFQQAILVLLMLIASAAIGQETGGSPPAEPTWLQNPPDLVQRLPPVIPESPPPADKNSDYSSLMPGSLMPGHVWATLITRQLSGDMVSYRAGLGAKRQFRHARSKTVGHGAVGNDVFQDGPRPSGGWMLSAGVQNRSIETQAVLPDTHQPYPDELWNVNMGLTYFRRLDNDWSWGGGVNFGSASDRPFASIDEMFVGMNAFLRIPSGEHNAWMFSLMYAPMGELRFP